MDYYVYCLDADPNAPGFQIADEYAVSTSLMRKLVWHTQEINK